MLFDDLLGIGDPDAALPTIDPDARRRRLTAFVNAAVLAHETPAVYVVEDAHWIDEVSQSMIADFLNVISRTPSVVLITCRPHYQGALAQVPGVHTIFLAPLNDADTTALLDELLGSDPSTAAISALIAGRAAGNPFFIEEMYASSPHAACSRASAVATSATPSVAEVTVPATLQATIASRIDVSDPKAKRTLNAAAAIGLRFTSELLAAWGLLPVSKNS